MSKTETMTCDECFGRYKPETCPKCNGTGITTTGEVVGTPLPRWPEVRPIREESGARAMSDKATTTTCSACGGTGFFDARHSDRFCPTCEGTGTAPNGNSPENPESSGEVAGTPGPTVAESIERLERDEQTITVTHNGAATAPFPDRYIGPQPDTPTRNGTCDHCGGRGKVLGPLDEIQTCGVCDGTGDEWIPKSILDSAPRLHVECACDECAKPRDATGHDGCIRGLEKAKAEAEYLRNKLHETERAGDIRIAEQAAEIERLRERVSGLEQLHASWADGSLAELTAERDALRLAVDHLKAERDELKGKLDVQQEFIDDYRKTIDRLRTEVERLKGDIEELTIQRDALKAKLKDAETVATLAADRKRLLGEANVRAEKYLRVIAAQSDMIEAQERHNEIALRLSQAYSVAGFATDVLRVGDVPRGPGKKRPGHSTGSN